jgi:polysaccharide pyruvyl transferase WcaK-like protein
VSRRFLAQQGRDVSGDRIVPDVVFGLRPTIEHASAHATSPRPTTNARRKVGVGLMTYRGWRGDDGPDAAIYRTYLAKIGDFVTWLLERGYDVRLVTGAANDQEAVDDVIGRVGTLAADGRLQVSKADRLDDLCRDLAGTDLVVATRYHNVIAALLAGRPVISIGYAEKNRELLAHFGLDGACQHVETFDLDRLQRQFSELAAGAVARQPGILAGVDQLRAALDEELDRRFGGRGGRAAA